MIKSNDDEMNDLDGMILYARISTPFPQGSWESTEQQV